MEVPNLLPIKGICPKPNIWLEIYSKLAKAWRERSNHSIPRPPMPIVLDGWGYATSRKKRERWVNTIHWATMYGFIHEIPILAQNSYLFEE